MVQGPMTAPLIRSQIVLHQLAEGVYEDAEGDTLVRLEMVAATDLGHPDCITVTIEPGDQLNG